MERRNFIRLGVAGIGASMLTSEAVWADKTQHCSVGDIYYTQESPGRWSEKVAGHLPNIGLEKKQDKIVVNVTTAHEMKGYEHYIVKHVLLDKDYKFLNEHLFDPTKDKTATSTFTLDDYSGNLYVLSMCNKHDIWLNSVKV